MQLPRALQKRLVGRILNQSVLEAVYRLRRRPLLVQELSTHQALEAVL